MQLAVSRLATDAEQLGEAAGGVIFLVVLLGLGVTLLVLGVRRRSSAKASPTWEYGGPAAPAAPATAPWERPAPPPDPGYFAPPAPPAPPAAWPAPPVASPPPPPAWPAPPPAWPATAPASSRGTGLIVGGAVVLVLALLVGAGQAARLLTSTERRVALPDSVLGLERADGAGAQIAESALQAAPEDLIDPHAALYGTPGLSVLVIAARAHTSFPSRQLDSFRKGFEAAGRSSLTNGRNVDAGDLGGAARCWIAHLNGTTPGVCIFVDRGSLVATIDFLPGGVEEAAKRGLQIREATVHAA